MLREKNRTERIGSKILVKEDVSQKLDTALPIIESRRRQI